MEYSTRFDEWGDPSSLGAAAHDAFWAELVLNDCSRKPWEHTGDDRQKAWQAAALAVLERAGK